MTDPRGFAPWAHEPDEFDQQADDDLRDPFDEEEAEAEMNCGRYPDGSCSLAGTWECESECPFR
jgi:hypothetical protein